MYCKNCGAEINENAVACMSCGFAKNSGEKFCANCGSEINLGAIICTKCGANVNSTTAVSGAEKKTQASIILGIIGIVFAWIFALVGHITSIIGIVLGAKEYKETNKSAGLILSIVGEVCSIISSLIGILAFSGLY